MTIILSIIFLQGSFLSFINKTGDVINIGFTNIVRSIQGQAPEIIGKILPLTILVILVAVLSLITIFLFKNRKLQLLLSGILTGLICVLLLVSFYYSYSVMSKYDASLVPGVKMALPFLQLIFSVLAYRGIKKDDRLVKSYDRLR
jgi:glucan phosphoethanolaminetransferase (alkaline phosphatase superfamily)